MLFVTTVITTTIAGSEWSFNKFIWSGMGWEDFIKGFNFSIPFLGILTVHEFGHYFTAKYHNIKVSLPYYIPFWLGFIASPSIGTMGAFIKIKEHIISRKKYFDIGISGPIAGFILAIFVLWYGFTTLPDKDYIYTVHPEYLEFSSIDEAISSSESPTINLGGNLLFDFFSKHLADAEKLPHPNENYTLSMVISWIFIPFLYGFKLVAIRTA